MAYTVKLRGVYNEQKPTNKTHPDFLREYKTAVLLALAQNGYLTQEECRRCIEKLSSQTERRSV